MVAAERTVRVKPGSDLARMLEEAGERTLILIKNGVRYRVTRESPTVEDAPADPWANYDPEKLMEGVRAVAGIITPEQAREWIANIYRWREEGSRPPNRP